MASTNQNHERGWLLNSSNRQPSLKRRLLFRLGLLFAIIWVVATLSTKFLAKSGTRDFLYQHTLQLAELWVDVLSQQRLSPVLLHEQAEEQLLIAWVDDTVVISQGSFSLEKPNLTETYIHRQGNYNWVVSSHCYDHICAVVGFRDLERRYAVRKLVALLSVPLLLVFFITGYAIHYAIESGLKPLHLLTKKVSSSSLENLELIEQKTPMKELSPLVDALNQLINNMTHQLNKERQFLDTCAHELRTPITALVTQIQTVGLLNNNKNDELLSIKASALRAVRVANQFLSLAKSNNRHHLSDQRTSFDCIELIRQVISDSLSHAENCDIQLKSATHITVYADPLALEMVCRNLIENALQYGNSISDDKNRILLVCRLQGNGIFLSIEDNGPGVDECDYNKLLERFYRLPNQSVSGAGLGLSIVKDIVDHYDGDIVVGRSSSLGGFKLELVLNGVIDSPQT